MKRNRSSILIYTLVLASVLIAIVILTIQIRWFRTHSEENLLSSDSRSFDEEDLSWLNDTWTGDFDVMARKNIIRALVPYSKTYYFLDGIDQRGFSYEMLKAFEKFINQKEHRDIIKIRVVIIPTKRDRLIPDLIEGRGDIAAGNLTITPERKKQVDFSNPGLSNVTEILVTAPGVPMPETVEDLSGKEIYVRASSSYHDSLLQINDRLKKMHLSPIQIKPLDELLEDEDVLEMMNAGIIPMTVIDSHKANCWSATFQNLNYCYHIRLRENGEIAWAVRKNSPLLQKKINEFRKTHKKGTLMGNILFNRYLGDCDWVSNPMEKDAFGRFERAVSLFKKYARQYDLDWVMVAALAYQESRIDQNKKNPSGAVGVMQILPSTAADPNVGITDIYTIEGNIHAGVKYLAFLRDRYFKNEPMDRLNKMLFTLASYNAGPAKVARLRRKAAKENLDPNIWFENVEITAARDIGRETVVYVSNIYKYYIAYRMIVDAGQKKNQLKKEYRTG